MQRVLVITKFVPTGKPFGGLIRTVRLADALRERFEVRMLGYVEDGEPSIRGRVPSLVNSLVARRPYQIARYDTPVLRRMVDDALTDFRPDAVHVDYLQLAPLAWDLDLPACLDLHNVESALADRIADTSRGAAKVLARRDGRLLRLVEDRAAKDFEVITVPSASEAKRMPGNVHVVPNGIDPGRTPLDVAPDPDLLCFVGIFSWGPNEDGAEWLVREVLPHLPERMRVQLVGRNPSRRVQALAGPRVEVTGEVPDTWPYVARSSVVLAPLLAPGGTRHKILEGLLAERPVVATPEAADGLEDLAGDGLVLASGPEQFAAEVVALAEDRAQAVELGRMGRRAVIDRYDWRRSAERLLGLYETYLGVA